MTNRLRIDFACFFFVFLSLFLNFVLDQLNTGGAGRRRRRRRSRRLCIQIFLNNSQRISSEAKSSSAHRIVFSITHTHTQRHALAVYEIALIYILILLRRHQQKYYKYIRKYILSTRAQEVYTEKKKRSWKNSTNTLRRNERMGTVVVFLFRSD